MAWEIYDEMLALRAAGLPDQPAIADFCALCIPYDPVPYRARVLMRGRIFHWVVASQNAVDGRCPGQSYAAPAGPRHCFSNAIHAS